MYFINHSGNIINLKFDLNPLQLHMGMGKLFEITLTDKKSLFPKTKLIIPSNSSKLLSFYHKSNHKRKTMVPGGLQVYLMQLKRVTTIHSIISNKMILICFANGNFT